MRILMEGIAPEHTFAVHVESAYVIAASARSRSSSSARDRRQFVCVTACFLAACSLLAPFSAFGQTPLQTKAVHIVVARRGWHVDIGFAAEDLAEPLNSVTRDFPGVQYVFFGLGDRHYLTVVHRNAPVLLRALWPGPALLLATALRTSPGAAFGPSHVVELTVTYEGLAARADFIWQALTQEQQRALIASRNEQGPAAGIPGPYEGSSFLDSRSTYSAFHTRNTWVAEALAPAGIPIRSRVCRSAMETSAQHCRQALAARKLGSILAHHHRSRIAGNHDRGVF